MTKNQFRDWVLKSVRILDGATGTLLQKKGMPAGVCPEKWALENPDILSGIQTDYINSGSDIIYTFTFGANSLKLKEFGIEDTEGYNRELARLSKKVAAGRAFVAGDIAPTGQMMEPFGIYSFEDIVNAYKRQVHGLLEGGVDMFAVETMMDIQEARAAVIAIKESCDLPVIATMTFGSGGHTINGTDPLTALITLQSLGVDAFGCNCSSGPSEMLELIRQIKPYAKVPLIAKPNAGIPKLIGDETVFSMDADEFSAYTSDFVKAGANLTGGCCGTTPLFIKKVFEAAKGEKGLGIQIEEDTTMISSARQCVSLISDMLSSAVGRRINPDSDRELFEELIDGSMDLLTEHALEQIADGLEILCIGAEAPGIDEAKTLAEMVKALSQMVKAPLCIESKSPEALEKALRIYPGRAVINIISAEEETRERILSVASKYGAAVVTL